MALQYLIPLVGLVDAVYDLVKIINRSPVKKNDTLITTIRNETTNQLDKVVDISKSDDVFNGLSSFVSQKRATAQIRTLESVSTVQRVTENNTTSLISVMGSRNKIMQEQNDLLRKQVEQMELANDLRSAKIFANYEATTALLTSLEMIARELKLARELGEVHQNIATAKNYLAYEKLDFELNGKTGLVNSQGEQISPLEDRAKKDSEQALEVKISNSIDWGDVMDSVTTSNNEINDEAINLFEQLVNIHKLDEATMKKIDVEVKKINWGSSNG